jgi:hypothetical protein
VLLDWSQPDHLSMREIAASGLLPLSIPEFESDQPCSAARQRQGRLRRRARGAVSVGLHPAPIMTAFAEQIPLRCTATRFTLTMAANSRSHSYAARPRRRGDRMMGCRGYDFRERHPTSRRGASLLPIVPVYPQGHQGGTSLPRRGRVLPAIRPEERDARTLMSPRVVIGTRPRPTLSGVSIHR